MVRSRVSSGMRSTTLVAAMISSAGSDEKSSWVLCRAISTLIGMIVNWRKHVRNSGLSISRTRRPNWMSFANSHSMMSEMAKGPLKTNRHSRGRRVSLRTATSMGVSRFSMPPYPGRKDVAFNFDLPFHQANQRLVVHRRKGNDPRHRTTGFRQNDPWRVKIAQHFQAVRLEFADAHCFRFGFHTTQMISHNWRFG